MQFYSSVYDNSILAFLPGNNGMVLNPTNRVSFTRWYYKDIHHSWTYIFQIIAPNDTPSLGRLLLNFINYLLELKMMSFFPYG